MTTESRNKLITDNMKLVYHCLKKFHIELGSNNYEDLFQDGCIGLIKAADIFDPTKDVKFSTLACKCIMNEIRCTMRKDFADKRLANKDSISLNHKLKTDDENEFIDSIEYDDPFNYDNVELIERFNKLKVRNKDIYIKWLKGMSPAELYKQYPDRYKNTHCLRCDLVNITHMCRKKLLSDL